MSFGIMFFALLSFTFSCSAYGTVAHPLEHPCTLFVEPGDSYIRLFGPDWLRVFQANSNMAFYDKSGRLTQNPEKLVVGTRLNVPAGTYLTRRAMERLSRYEEIKMAALNAIREAESFLKGSSQGRSGVYDQAMDLLNQAREAAKGLTSGFSNYIEVRRLAEEAIRCFRIDYDLREADRRAALLRDRMKKEKVFHADQIGMLHKQRSAILGLVGSMLFGLLLYMRLERKKNLRREITDWLNRHQDRLDRLMIKR